MSLFKRIKVIVNPAAGQDAPLLSTLNKVFRQHNIKWKLVITKDWGDGQKFARRAVKKENYDLVVAYGGDGTIMDAVNGMAGGDLPLAVLHGGTGNHVATELGVPINLERALGQIVTGAGKIQKIDLGLCNDDRYFILRADTGITTEMTRAATRDLKQRYGILAYVLALAPQFMELPRIEFRLTIDGEVIETVGVACTVTNVSSIGTLGLSLGTSVKITDGLLDVFVMNARLPSLLTAATGVIAPDAFQRAFSHRQGREITVETSQPRPFGLDGDAQNETTPFSVRVVPGILPIFVPDSS